MLNDRDGLARYLPAIRATQMLTVGEERALFERVKAGDRKARDTIIRAHLPFAVSQARKFCGYGLPLDDLVSEASVGMLQAIEKFDPNNGARFVTYAMWWIKAALRDYVARNVSLVRPPVHGNGNKRALFFKVRSAMRDLGLDGRRREDLDLLAKRFGVKVDDVVAMLGTLGGDFSLNAVAGDEDNPVEFIDTLLDEEAVGAEAELIDRTEAEHRHKSLLEALTVLNERERDIFVSRHLTEDAPPLHELGERYGVSRERIRQIEVGAYKKVEAALRQPV